MTKAWTGHLERSSGLYEKVLLDTLLKHEIAQCNRYGNPLAVLILTICGTPPEDDDLREKATTMIVHVINSNLRSSDMPGHYNEDFMILMPYTDAEGAISVGERLIAQTSALLDTPSLAGISVCAGLAVHGGGKSIEPPELIKRAQEAADKSRTEGAGNVVLYGT